jgi:hypothetical protein
MNNFLSKISTNEITLLKDINYLIDINKIGKFNYYYISNLEFTGINAFIKRLHTETVYVIIPLISMTGRDMVPHIILSKSFLLTNESSTDLVQDYLNQQLDKVISDFGLSNLENGKTFQLVFKYKSVILDLTKVPK